MSNQSGICGAWLGNQTPQVSCCLEEGFEVNAICERALNHPMPSEGCMPDVVDECLCLKVGPMNLADLHGQGAFLAVTLRGLA